MDGSKEISKDTMLDLEKLHAEFAAYVRHKYFSGKDIEGDEIYQEIVTIGGMIIKGSRFSPTLSYEDPVAYRNCFTGTCAIDKNVVAGILERKNRFPRFEFPDEPTGNEVEPARNEVEPAGNEVEPAGNEVELLDVHDQTEDSSDSLQEISADAWNEIQSAIKQANSGAGSSQKRP